MKLSEAKKRVSLSINNLILIRDNLQILEKLDKKEREETVQFLTEEINEELERLFVLRDGIKDAQSKLLDIYGCLID